MLWKDTVQKSPQLPGPHMNLGLWYDSIHSHKAAVQEFQTTARLANDSMRAHPNGRDLELLVDAQSNTGVVLIHDGQYVMAEQALRAGLTLVPGHGPTSINLSKVLMLEKRPAEAITVLDDAIRMRDTWSSSFSTSTSEGRIYANKGLAFTMLGNCDSANENFRRAERLDPDMPRGITCQ